MIQNDFDQFASDYRKIHTENIQKISGTDSEAFSEYKIVTVKKLLNGKHILDLGCGDGTTAKCISELCVDYSYDGIDISEKSIFEAERKNISNCKFVQYDGKNIPYEDETFDVVFIACVLHHIETQARTQILEEVYRVLKKGGVVIIFEHNPINPLTRKIVKECPFDEGVVLLKSSKIRTRLFEAGFREKCCIRYTIFMPRKGIFNRLLFMERWLEWCPLGGQYYCVSIK